MGQGGLPSLKRHVHVSSRRQPPPQPLETSVPIHPLPTTLPPRRRGEERIGGGVQSLMRPRGRNNTLDAKHLQGSRPRSKRARKIKTADDDQTPSEEEEDALQIQGGPPPRSKRPRKIKKAEDDAPPGFSSCTTGASQIQISESTRRNIGDRLHTRSSSTLHWEAKRSRTTLCRRDWSDLGDGPAGLIAERVLTTNGVIDFLRFRAVCRPWRRCSEAPRTRALLEDSRLHPRGWVMLLAEGEQLEPAAAPHRTRRQFLNVSTGQCIQVEVPELRDHGVLRSTDDDGLLLLLHKGTGGVCLLNPFTRQVAELPPITDGLLGYSPAHIGLRSRRCGGLVDGRWVFLYGHESRDGTLAFAKPGDERWVLVKIAGSLMSTMSFAGRFYGVTTDSVMVVDMPARGELPLRLVVAAKLAAGIHVMTDSVHLVDNGGELMLVHRRMRRVRGTDGDYKTTCKVYRVNLASGKATPASTRGRAIFIGHGRALAVSPQVFPGLSANAVYPALNFDERRGHLQVVGCYHLRDGRTESWDHGTRSGLAYPWCIADCLAAYVSG